MSTTESIRDPSRILTRVPELEEIAAESRPVRQAIESGRPHAVYRALRWARRLGRIRQHRELADELLANRRLFLEPSRGRLWLSTYNGIGMTFYGESDPDFVDGTHIATHFLTLLFIPIFPLGQYLVKRVATQGGGQSYLVMGRVPFGLPLQLWSRVLTIAIFLGFASALVSILRSSQHNLFFVLNELGAPVDVEVAGKTIHVESGSHEQADLPTGQHALTVYGPGRQLVERGSVQIRPGQRVIAWNVLGAAAAVLQTIEYRAHPGPRHEGPKPKILCGERTFTYRSVDYLFQEPPHTLRTSSGDQTRTYLGVAEPGPTACIGYLEHAGRAEEAARIVAAEAVLLDSADDALDEAVAVLGRLRRGEEAVALTQAALQRHPDSVRHHRSYQNAMLAAGRGAALRERYTATLPTEVSDDDRRYLRARILPAGSQALAAAHELVARAPQHPLTLSFAASVLCEHGEFAQAVEVYDRLAKLDAALAERATDSYARALVARGQTAQALQLIELRFNNAPPDEQLGLAALYAQAATAAGLPADGVERLIHKLHDGSPTAARQRRSEGIAEDDQGSLRQGFARFLAGLPPPADSSLPDSILRRWRAQEAGIRSPAAAVATDPAAIPELAGTFFLFFGEALRTDAASLPRWQQEAERRLLPAEAAELVRFLRGGGDLQLSGTDLRATALFIRSRDGGLPAAERARLLADARKLAVLPGPLTRVLEGWR